MATSKEKQELVEEIKGPHYYRIVVNGYGGETVYAKISKEAREFWAEVTSEHGDSDLVQYCIGSEEWTADEIISGQSDIEFDNIIVEDIPQHALFLHDPKEPDATGSPWYEAPGEKFHNNNAECDGAYITIEKVDSVGYDAKHLEDIIDGESINDFVQRIGDATDWEIESQIGLSETTDYSGDARTWESMDKGDQVFQFHSAEKGTFFEAYLETPGLFDETKLKVIVDEDAGGNDLVWGFTYDGEEIDNEGGGDTNGKGYYAWVWEQLH